MVITNKNKKGTFLGIFIVLIGFIFLGLDVSASTYISGTKSVNPTTIYLGEEATITLTVKGEGSSYEVVNPLDMYIVFDKSGSMGSTKICEAKDVAAKIVNNLDSSYIKMGLVSFNNKQSVDSGLTTNKNTLNSYINSYKGSGQTNIGDAIKVAVNQLESSGNAKTIVLISDGGTNLPSNAKNYAKQQAEIAGQKGVKIYVIGVGSISNTNKNLLESIASSSGGLYWHYTSSSASSVAGWLIESATTRRNGNLAGSNIVIKDVLEEGLSISYMPNGCSYSGGIVTCNAGSLTIGQTKSFSFRVNVNNKSLNHLNKRADVSYDDYRGGRRGFELNNPVVTILERPVVPVCDSASPVVRINSPLPSVYGLSNVKVDISAVDNVRVEKVWFELDGKNYTYSSPIILTLSNKNYYLTAYAEDNCGNVGSSSVSFRVDNLPSPPVCDGTAPVIRIVSPTPRVYNTSSVQINLETEGKYSIDRIWFELDGKTYDYSLSRTLTLLDGNYNLVAYVRDSCGSESKVSVSFAVNTTPNGGNGNGGGCGGNGSCGNGNQTVCKSCGGNTRAPVNDFDNSYSGSSISITDKKLSYTDSSVPRVSDDDSRFDSYKSGKLNVWIFNLIVFISILVILLLILFVYRNS